MFGTGSRRTQDSVRAASQGELASFHSRYCRRFQCRRCSAMPRAIDVVMRASRRWPTLLRSRPSVSGRKFHDVIVGGRSGSALNGRALQTVTHGRPACSAMVPATGSP